MKVECSTCKSFVEDKDCVIEQTKIYQFGNWTSNMIVYYCDKCFMKKQEDANLKQNEKGGGK